MNKLSSLLLFVFLSVSTRAAENVLPDVQYVFQKDYFLTKNDCNKFRASNLNAFRVEAFLPTKNLKKNLKIEFRELNSQFSQVIHYNKKTFFYPGVFGNPGHHEYTMPDCVEAAVNCRMGFFVFMFDSILKKETWDIEIKITDEKRAANLLTSHLKNIKNQFIENTSDYTFAGLDLRYLDKSKLAVAYLDPSKVKKLLQEGFAVSLIYSWRTSLSQIEYTEEVHDLSLNHEWFKSKSIEFAMREKIENPTYLSFMVYAKKESTAYESKIVTINKKSSFFESCSSR